MSNNKEPLLYFESTKENVSNFGKQIVVIEPPKQENSASKWLEEYNKRNENSSTKYLSDKKDKDNVSDFISEYNKRNKAKPNCESPTFKKDSIYKSFTLAKDVNVTCNSCGENRFFINEDYNVTLNNGKVVYYCVWCSRNKHLTCKKCGKFHKEKDTNAYMLIGTSCYCTPFCKQKQETKDKHYYCIVCFERDTDISKYSTMTKNMSKYYFCKNKCFNDALFLMRNDTLLKKSEDHVIHLKYLHKDKNI